MAEHEIARRRKAMREARGMTQPEVAEAIGVSLRAYQKIEAGGGMRPGNLRKLADVLVVPMSELCDESHDQMLFASADDVARLEQKLDQALRLLATIVDQDDATERAPGPLQPLPTRPAPDRTRSPEAKDSTEATAPRRSQG